MKYDGDIFITLIENWKIKDEIIEKSVINKIK
jgi:hypothetical protein